MTNYQKHYPAPSTYPPRTLSTQAHDPRFAASLPPVPTTLSVAAGGRAASTVPAATVIPSGTSPSYSHRPLRPFYDQPDKPRHETPRSASSATNNHLLPDGAPDFTPHSADNGYTSRRRADNMYHVSQTTHSSRKRSHRDDSSGVDANPDPRYRGNRERHTVYSGESFAT
ncbi:hypothetical protein BDW60DRAFT_2181 [Aspergillus nidulans var. acristatus]